MEVKLKKIKTQNESVDYDDDDENNKQKYMEDLDETIGELIHSDIEKSKYYIFKTNSLFLL